MTIGASPVGMLVEQSIGCESSDHESPPPVSVNFTGTSAPASLMLIAGGFSIGRWNPPKTAAVQLAGRLNACTPSARLLLLPWLALEPSPRLAKARQISHWLTPVP